VATSLLYKAKLRRAAALTLSKQEDSCHHWRQTLRTDCKNE